MHIQKIIVWLLVPVFYPGSLWALAGCFVSAGSVAAFEDNCNLTSQKIVFLFPCFTKYQFYNDIHTIVVCF